MIHQIKTINNKFYRFEKIQLALSHLLNGKNKKLD